MVTLLQSYVTSVQFFLTHTVHVGKISQVQKMKVISYSYFASHRTQMSVRTHTKIMQADAKH